jgi:TPR repeat protein
MPPLTKSAEAGHPEAQVFLGYHFENGYPNDMAVASRWYRLSAEQGHAGGEYHYALCFLLGNGVEKDEPRGLELMRQAADRKHRGAMVKLSELYARGIGVPRNDQDTPFQLLLLPARLNFEPACSELSTRYRLELGTERDLVSAARWYCQSAILSGFPQRLDKEIWGVPPEQPRQTELFSAALSLFLKAVRHKDSDAMLHIGRMYATGQDVPQNPATAWQWFNLAAASGSGEAIAARAMIESSFAAQNLAAAKKDSVAFTKDFADLASQLP